MNYSSLCSSDKKLIDLVAKLWIENGGDSEGISWTWQAIKERVAQLEKEKLEDGQD